MVSASKLLPPHIAAVECRHILHPWTNNCFLAYLEMYLSSCFGSAGYFALMYLFQYLVRVLKSKKQSTPKDLIRTYIRSCLLFSSAVASLFIGFSCLLRHTLGKFYYYSIVLIPATLAGLAIISETPKNKDFFTVSFANLAIESWLNKVIDLGKLKWTLNGQTFAFMILTSLLSYLFTESENKNQYFWFFIPPNEIKDGKILYNESSGVKSSSCFHKGNCIKCISSSFIKYFSTGFCLKILKLIFSNFGKPKNIFLSLFKRKTYKFAAFLGFYALIYHSSRCLFYKKNKRYYPLHDLISGFISGFTYIFEPNISIFNSAIITIFQILTEIGFRKRIIPDLPYRELVFAISTGFLFHSRFYTPHYCPPLMHYVMSSITYRKSDYLVNNYKKLLKL